MSHQASGELINNRYLLNGVSGRGGWGITYRAHDLTLGIDVALKMSRGHEGARGLNSLIDELALVQRINHSGVVRYLDYGLHDNRPVLIMELLEAPSLFKYASVTDLSTNEVVKILVKLCDAVSAIHAAQVIHCDLKPQNLISRSNQRLKVIDFGLSRALNEAGHYPMNFIAGTPLYMAPEQFKVPSKLTPAVDVYSIALISIWLLTGELEWACGTQSLLKWRLKHPDQLPTTYDTLPTPLRRALKPALVADPTQRLQDLQLFKEFLFEALDVSSGDLTTDRLKDLTPTPIPSAWVTTTVFFEPGMLKSIQAHDVSDADQETKLSLTLLCVNLLGHDVSQIHLHDQTHETLGETISYHETADPSPWLIDTLDHENLGETISYHETADPSPWLIDTLDHENLQSDEEVGQSDNHLHQMVSPEDTSTVNEHLQDRDRATDALLRGMTEDLSDLLNSSPELNVFTSANMVSQLKQHDFFPEIKWSQLDSLAEACDTELILMLNVEFNQERIELEVHTLSTKDRLTIAHYRVQLLKDELLNQLGSVALELSRQLKVGLNYPRAQRANVAKAADLLFEARDLARQSWHTDVSPALALYESALALSPNDSVILAETARVTARSSMVGISAYEDPMKKAIERAEAAYRQVPHHPQCMWALGYVRFYQGQSEEAVSLLDHALSLGVDRAEIRDLIGRIRCEIGPLDEAIKHLNHALSQDRELFTTRLDLARLNCYLGDWDRVDELLDHPVKSDAEFGALGITRARLDLWRPSAPRWSNERDRSREGALFTFLIDLFTVVKVERRWHDAHHIELERLINTSPENGRMRILYLQFLCECMAYLHGPKSTETLKALGRVRLEGLSDQLWMTYCPLWQGVQSKITLKRLRET